MQRRAKTYVTGVALVVMLSGSVTACSGSSDDTGGGDTKPGSSSSAPPPAEPGRYSTLPDPCDAVDVGTLKKLLPGAEAAQSAAGGDTSGKGGGTEAGESPFDGEATVTYDTDRRAGCRWKSATSLATRHLTVDLERVVSYDPATSDDEQAQLLYDERAGQAEIPTDDDSSAPPEDESGDSGDGNDDGGDKSDGGGDSDDKAAQGGGSDDAEQSDKSGKDGKADENGDAKDEKDGGDGSEKSDSASEAPDSSASPDEDLSPRMLDDIGDNAYIDDQLDTGDSGVHRDITLVFRSANVIATVTYDQWLTDKRRTPDSAELQEKARSVAAELAAGFDDN
ncbi:hypothetical protein K378_05517 [Streptomyces sp. Amel2xB2]|uniref:hypothetical protein n=1 Tax=Streptomyces sp. Amel2xB2 TaxID=1305829 RepID=UPI000DC012D7|nr:hypothetical protein [Streptomyces sp. Amel2xB2]RAJ57359.1 hypothetical protein K378_05517 [Streptomyces sp. Amel2xB2]